VALYKQRREESRARLEFTAGERKNVIHRTAVKDAILTVNISFQICSEGGGWYIKDGVAKTPRPLSSLRNTRRLLQMCSSPNYL
jgi:hypothetical protein